jgi:L-phenylalanine/L-methionine N-acetyltransferase
VSRPPAPGPDPPTSAPTGVEVRAARPGDAAGWLAHVADVAAEGRFIRTERIDPSRWRMRRRLREAWTGRQAYITAVAGDRVVGTLHIAREDGPATEHIASIGMSVDKGWRGRGVGSALLAEAFRWARWARVEKLGLTVYPHNQAAINLYKKFGFTEEGRLIGHSKKSYGYEDEIVMGRWL